MIMLLKWIISSIFLTVLLSRVSSSLQNVPTSRDSLGLKFFKGRSISTKENNLRFSIETPLSDKLTFHLVFNGTPRHFPTFQEEKQRNDYSVLSVNNIVYIIKNGQVINETQSSILEQIVVVAYASSDAFWTVFNVRGDGSGKDLKVDCTFCDPDEYTFGIFFKGRLSRISSNWNSILDN
jgi:hypothetical protein